MNPDEANLKEHQCSALRAAPAALEWLATKAPARPYHIFETVCNLINTEGVVLTLMLEPAEMNPLVLEIDCLTQHCDFTALIQPESEVRQELDHLCVGELRVKLNAPETWDSIPDWSAARENRQRVQDFIGDITRMLIDNHSTESLAVLLRRLDPFSDPTLLGWQKRAHEPIARLLEGLEEGDTVASLAGASSLAGLGMGLTPSGDDFTIGVMHALWCSLPAGEAAVLCGELLNAVASKTNRLSASYLACSARGEAGEAWHTLIQAMAQGDAIAISAPVKSLIGLGHTSGQDALTGFLLGLGHILQP